MASILLDTWQVQFTTSSPLTAGNSPQAQSSLPIPTGSVSVLPDPASPNYPIRGQGSHSWLKRLRRACGWDILSQAVVGTSCPHNPQRMASS